MVDTGPSRNGIRKRHLRDTYAHAPAVGLVLGAGVTVGSGVHMCGELALRLMEHASQRGRLADRVSTSWVRAFTERQRMLLGAEDGKAVPAEEVVHFVRTHLRGDRELLRKLVREVLYEEAPVERTVSRVTFESNATLDAVLSFCAAPSDSALAPYSTSAHAQYEVEANVKVGGILTTNYDNLVEGAFHTKYRRKLLKPVGRAGSADAVRDRRVIPVYHIHGYIGYREVDDDEGRVRGPHIVIAEDDYFDVFYDPLGFGNYVAMDFLRRFPCLFIGCSMADKNLRRFLFHLARDEARDAAERDKFAILQTVGKAEEELTDAILLSYGVETVWVREFDEITEILRGVYTAVPGVEPADWDYVENYRWS
jgi:hypothetical protein